VVGGVSGGLGDYFNVDPVVFRILFAVTTLVGGAGLLAYVIAWIVVPRDDGSGRPDADHSVGRRIGLAVLVLIGAGAALVLGAGLLAGSAWAAASGGALGIAIAIIALGVVLTIAALTGANRRVIAGLAVLTALLALPAAVVAAAGFDIDGSVGDRTYRPATASAIPHNGYKLGVGKLEIDTRRLDWKRGDVVDLKLKLGVGDAVVVVPDNVCVENHIDVGAGAIDLLGTEQDGLDVDSPTVPAPSTAPRLRLDGDVGIGALEVVRHPDARTFDGAGGDHNVACTA
jgi:phage shock protein PspC (stress-responsive transcriptional regulator)